MSTFSPAGYVGVGHAIDARPQVIKPHIAKRAGFWQVEAKPGAIERLVSGHCCRQEAHWLSEALRWCSVRNATVKPPHLPEYRQYPPILAAPDRNRP